MIIRYRIKCDTCKTPHTLRIGVGNERLQRHSITCSNCGENFIVEMDVDFDKPSAIPRCVENCSESENEGLIVNIDPRAPVPDKLAHTDMVFPWMEHVPKAFKLDELAQQLPLPNGAGPMLIDIFDVAGGQYLLLDSWKILKKGWSLTVNNKLDLATNVFQN